MADEKRYMIQGDFVVYQKNGKTYLKCENAEQVYPLDGYSSKYPRSEVNKVFIVDEYPGAIRLYIEDDHPVHTIDIRKGQYRDGYPTIATAKVFPTGCAVSIGKEE